MNEPHPSMRRDDIAELENRDYAGQRFRAAPPRYPMLDLPLSAVADFFVLGVTAPIAAVLKIVER